MAEVVFFLRESLLNNKAFISFTVSNWVILIKEYFYTIKFYKCTKDKENKENVGNYYSP